MGAHKWRKKYEKNDYIKKRILESPVLMDISSGNSDTKLKKHLRRKGVDVM